METVELTTFNIRNQTTVCTHVSVRIRMDGAKGVALLSGMTERDAHLAVDAKVVLQGRHPELEFYSPMWNSQDGRWECQVRVD